MERQTMFRSRFGMLAMILIGLLLLLGAAWSVWSTRAWLAHVAEVPGTVIEMVSVRDRDRDSTLVAPRVRFQTSTGTTIVFQSRLASSPPAYRVGQLVPVLYDLDQPQWATVRGFASLWLMPVVLGIVGSVFFGIGAATMLLSNRGARGLGRPAALA